MQECKIETGHYGKQNNYIVRNLAVAVDGLHRLDNWPAGWLTGG